MARSTGPIYIADNSVTAINDALQQLLFMIDGLRGQHDDTVIEVGPHTHDPEDPTSGGPIDVPANEVSHDDLVDVTADQHHNEDHATRHQSGGADDIKLDDLAAPDDNTDLNSSASAHGLLPKLSGVSTEFLNGQGAFASVTAEEATDVENVEGDATAMIWEQVLAGGGITITELANGSAIAVSADSGTLNGTIWMPDAKPTTTGADDDEFADESGGVPSGWTEVDHDSNMTVTEDAAGLLMTKVTAVGNNNSGIYKSIPAGDFTIWSKIGVGGTNLQNNTGGLAIWEDAASTTAKLINLRIYMGTANSAFDVDLWTDYNSFSSSLKGPIVVHTGAIPHGAVYLRIRRTTATYSFDYSHDGVNWSLLYSNTISFTPTHYGIFTDNVTTAGLSYCRAQFFRYVASDVGINGLVKGNRIIVAR